MLFFSAITCTSRTCEWNQGSLAKDPQVINERQYTSYKFDVIRRATFDVRPTRCQTDFPSQAGINRFLCDLSYKECHWSLLMKIHYEDGDYSDEDLYQFYPERRDQFYESLEDLINRLKPNPNHEGPFEVRGTRGQSANDLWGSLRSVHATASTCRKVTHFRTDSAKMNHLRSHMWKIDRVLTKAMAYGIRNEAQARNAYMIKMQEIDPTVQVQETGLFLNTQLKGLSCSPDGLVNSEYGEPVLLEIKCPYSLKNIDPNDFEEQLPLKKRRKFCLMRNDQGEIKLKVEHDYYDQVQMCMGMTNVEHCDFVVWTPKGMVITRIPFNKLRWERIKDGLLKFHRTYQVPEYFLMRTPRGLLPLALT